MPHAILKARLVNLRTELQLRNQWPLVEPRPLNPRSPGIWRRFLASGDHLALLDRTSLPSDPETITPYLRRHLGMPPTLDAHFGNARPYLLFLVRRHQPQAGRSPALPLPLDFLGCEDALAGLETVLAWLNDGN